MPGRSVPGFIPSISGFRFNNAFPRVPLRFIGIPGVIRIPIGDASNGLCGGMVFAARDYFEAGRPPPPDTTPPSSRRLFDYLVRRLLDSFNLPFGPARYLELMNPALPDREPVLRWMGWGPHGRVWRMAREEWPKVRSDIDAGHPSPLGLVMVKSFDPFDLKHNHQVLAYAYELRGADLMLRLYEVKAFVILASGRPPSPEELVEWCARQLAPHKLPRYIEPVTDLPRTSTGQVAKHLLSRERTSTEHDVRGS